MAFENLNELQALHIDALTEIGNIGSGNAATALATMMNVFVDIAIPTVTIQDYEQISELLGGPETPAIGVTLDIAGDLKGKIIHILHPDFANKLVNTFYPVEIKCLEDISEMDLSVLSEMGNITSGAYVNALASLTNLFIDIRPPFTQCDTIKHILDKSIEALPELGNQMLFIDEKLTVSNSEIKSSLVLMLEMDSLKKLFDRLKVPY